MGKSVTREDLIEKLMNENGKDFPSKAAALRTFNGIFDLIKNEVAKGNEVAIAKFGTFYSREQAAVVGTNNLTGEKMNVPAKTVPKFRAASAFKDAVK